MTVADIDVPRHGWYRLIPRSWIVDHRPTAIECQPLAMDQPFAMERHDRRQPRDDRDRELDLDDTRSFRRRYDDQLPIAPKVQVPFAVIVTIMIYLIGQLVGGVWWAATLQSNLQHEIADRSKEEKRLWDDIQTYRAEVNALRIEIARVQTNVRQIQR